MESLPRPPPAGRDGFRVALLCVLKAEFDAVEAVFDEYWDDRRPPYGKVYNDTNTYSTGRICDHDVVLAFLPGMGKVNASAVTTNLRLSYPNVKLALAVGVCGGSPIDPGNEGQEIVLGDVIISTGVVQVDFGRQYPDGVHRKDTVKDEFGRPNNEIRAFLNRLNSKRTRGILQKSTSEHLSKILAQPAFEKSRYPGVARDTLHRADYRHKHQPTYRCDVCQACTQDGDSVCSSALESSCSDLGCDPKQSVMRKRLATESARELLPMIHFGLFASADHVMKSASHRDRAVNRENVIGFEMEGAGTWDTLPTIIIKGVCDYADTHKQKDWQSYAAASAAACMKGLLKLWTVEDGPFVSHSRAVLEVEQAKLRAPVKCYTTVPFVTVDHYTEREELLAELESKLHTNHPAARPEDGFARAVAITGLGGCGKTQLALRYIEKHRDQYKAIFWINGETEETVLRSFETVALEIDVPLAQDQHSRRAWESPVVIAVLRWLRNQPVEKWLVVVDNADDPTWGLRKVIPMGSTGSVILTSRLEEASLLLNRSSAAVRVYKMTREEATSLLLAGHTNADGLHPEETAAAQKIVTVLDCLALAIDLARAYLSRFRSPRPFSQYLARFIKHQDQVLTAEWTRGFSQYEKTIATVWDLSFRAIEEGEANKDKHAGSLLRVLSFFKADAIQNELFRWASAGLDAMKMDADTPQETCRLPDWLSRMLIFDDGAWDDFAFQEAITILQSHSLIQPLAGDWPGFSLHLLVQWRTQQSVRADKTLWAQWMAQIVLAASYHSLEETPEYRRHFVAHLKRLEGDYSHERRYIEDALHKAWVIARVYSDEGLWDEAEKLQVDVMQRNKARLGGSHPETLSSISDLASTYSDLGRWDEAETLQFEVMQQRIATLGKNHPDTLIITGNLALTYLDQGRSNEAERLQVEVIQQLRATLSEDHPDLLVNISNLAATYDDQGRWNEAEVLQVEVMQQRRAKLGEDHPDTLTSIHNLASTYSYQGRWNEAENLKVQVVQQRKAKLGEDHPDTLASMNNLASTYSDQGRWDEAEKLQVEVMQQHKTKLGGHHPDTLISLANLAFTYRSQGRLDEAEKLEVDTE